MGRMRWLVPLSILAAAIASACGDATSAPDAPAAPLPPDADAGGAAPPGVSNTDPVDIAIASATDDERTAFRKGDALFDLVLRDADGLGPLYTRSSCGGCHAEASRGPGSVQRMVVVTGDGFTPAADQSALPFGNTVHPLLAGGGKTAIVPPTGIANLKLSHRLGPSVLGRGYLDAVLDSEIERMVTEQATRTDAIHGRINHVVFQSEMSADTRFHNHVKGDPLIGRFGLKARIGTIDDFTADALQGDMGITSPLRPVEIANPDNLTDDMKTGVDVTLDSVAARSFYLRLIAIPNRIDTTPEMAPGAALFAQVNCAACHVPSLHTRADYPIRGLADIDAPVYTDFLLHDMGASLADGIVEGEAGPSEWRTPPLIGLRFQRTYLHDARATTIRDAILMHDGQAADAVARFSALSPADQATLVTFVEDL